jgi:hypothetical protein
MEAFLRLQIFESFFCGSSTDKKDFNIIPGDDFFYHIQFTSLDAKGNLGETQSDSFGLGMAASMKASSTDFPSAIICLYFMKSITSCPVIFLVLKA